MRYIWRINFGTAGFLKKQIELAAAGRMMGGAGGRLRFEDLIKILERDYTYNQRRSLDRAKGAFCP